MKVLITGAAGYISSGIIKELINNPDVEAIVALDRVGVELPQDLLNGKLTYQEVNLEKVDENWWGNIVATNEIDTIYYMDCIENINTYSTTVALNTILLKSDLWFINFLENRDNITDLPLKIIYMSTDKIYYNDTFPNENHNIVLTETGNICCNDFYRNETRYFYSYVVGKVLAETRLNIIQNIDIRIIRPFAITGPGRLEDPISKIILDVFLDKDINVFEDGSQGVAFTHVNDLVKFLTNVDLFNPEIKKTLTSNIINFCRVRNYVNTKQLVELILNKIKGHAESQSKVIFDQGEKIDNIFREIQQTPQIRNMVKFMEPTIPLDIILEEMIKVINPVNNYVDLVINDVIFDDLKKIIIVGTAEPLSSITAWFGNGEIAEQTTDSNGDFQMEHEFEYAVDIYPIELKVISKESIQYMTVVIAGD